MGRNVRVPEQLFIEAPTSQTVLEYQYARNSKNDTTPSVENTKKLIFKNAKKLTVTKFDNGQPNQDLTVLGDGYTTIKHSARIKTAKGADTLLLKDRVYRFTYFNGAWVEDAGDTAASGGTGSTTTTPPGTGTTTGALTRSVISRATGVIVAGAEEVGSFQIARSFVINKVTVNRPARIRFYCSAAFRTADLLRPVGTDPTGEFGLLLELVLINSFLAFSLAPPAPGYNDDSPITSTIYYAIRNDDTTDGIVSLDIDTTTLVP